MNAIDHHLSKPAIASRTYSARQAGRLTQLSTQTVKLWITGWQNWNNGGSHDGLGGARRRVTPGVTFEEMLTLRVVKTLRASGLNFAAIRRVASMASAEFGCRTPLVTQRFRNEGAQLVLAMEDQQRLTDDPDDPEPQRTSTEVMVWQQVFAEFVDDALFANVDWEAGRVARWWPMGHARSVVVDPRVLAGAPHIETARIPTAAIATAARTSRDVANVAEAHGISEREVSDGVAFEYEWLKAPRH